MKKLIENIFSVYSHIIEFLKKDRLLGIRNAFYIIVSAFVFWVGFANILPQYNNFLFYFFLLVLFSIMFLFSVDSNRIDIKMITKGEFSTAHEFLKEFSHRSFLYCLFVYSTIISSWVFFLKSIVFFALNLNFPSTYYKDFIIIFVVSYNISERPVLNQVLKMLDSAFEKIPDNIGLIFHSDQGWQYQHKKYQKKLLDKGIVQSMSRKGNCLDNSIMENFFGLLKSELFYLRKFESMDEFKLELEKYIDYYNNKRIKSKLKGLSPVQYRLQSSLVA